MKITSWKTTLSGVGVILAAVANALTEFATGGVTGVNFSVLITGLSAGIGLLVAKDNNVTGGTKQQ